MNITKLQKTIPASFEYRYVDAEDVEQTEIISIKLRRMSFKQAAAKEFRVAMKSANEDAMPIAQLLSELIGEWDLSSDDDGNNKIEITKGNIAAMPPDFVSSLAECVFKRLFPDPMKAVGSVNGSELAANSLGT